MIAFMIKELFKTISENKKAFHDYFVIESIEVGVELKGTEVKSLRQGKGNIKESWVSIIKNELFINNMHISQYEKGNIFNQDPIRIRKLLAHRKEINRLYETVKMKGYTLIPLSIYFKGSKIKIKLGVCKGKKNYDKRATIAAMDAKRDMQRAMKEKNR